jgi:hypothetical protein
VIKGYRLAFCVAKMADTQNREMKLGVRIGSKDAQVFVGCTFLHYQNSYLTNESDKKGITHPIILHSRPDQVQNPLHCNIHSTRKQCKL